MGTRFRRQVLGVGFTLVLGTLQGSGCRVKEVKRVKRESREMWFGYIKECHSMNVMKRGTREKDRVRERRARRSAPDGASLAAFHVLGVVLE